jgi:PAS domain S-box-containing protein
MNDHLTKPVRILVASSESANVTLSHALLAESPLAVSELKLADSLACAHAALDNDEFDVLLVDLDLPDSRGLDTLVSVGTKYPRVAIVAIAGQYSENFGLEAIASGAQEYLVKGTYDKHTLIKSILYAIERKNAEIELLLAEEKYRTIFENSAVGITVANEQGRLVSWNEFTEHLLDMAKDDLYLRPVKSLYPVGEWERIRSCDIRQKGMQHHFETRMVQKDGRLIDIDISLSALKNSKGRTIGSIGVITDITERKRIYGILDRKQKNLQAMFDAAPVGMLLIDESMIVRRVNSAISRMLRREYAQIINRLVGDALGCLNSVSGGKGCGYDCTSTDCLLRNTFKNVLETGCSVRELEIQAELRIGDDEVTPWLHISAEPVTIDGYKRIVVAVNDITERKQAEERLRETMELKSQFISTVSHELRTPLACMKEAIAIVLDGAAGTTNDKQKHFLDIAKRNIERLGALIDNVLDFQKLDAGKMKLDMQVNNISEIVKEACNTMASMAEKKGIDLAIKLGDDLPEVRFDGDKIIQVLTNLLSNAIKFTPEHGRVSVCAMRRGEELAISVSDTGMGVPKDALARIFDRFYRVERPGKHVQGTGLGLAIVHRIVMMHGGRIEVESDVDQGSTFTVSLPLKDKSTPVDVAEGTNHVLSDK